MKRLTALFFVTAFASGAALASEEFSFETADANGDGQLSQTEVSNDTRVSANFDTWDENGDGFLDQSEVDNGLAGGNEYETISDPTSNDSTSDEALQDDRKDVEYDPMWEDNGLDNTGGQDTSEDAGSADESLDHNSGVDE